MSRCIPIDWCQDEFGKPISGSPKEGSRGGVPRCSVCEQAFDRQSPRWIEYPCLFNPNSLGFWAHYCRIERLMGRMPGANVNAGWLLHEHRKAGPAEMEEPLEPGPEELP